MITREPWFIIPSSAFYLALEMELGILITVKITETLRNF